MDAAAQLHFLLRAQQRDLTDLLEVVLHRVVQQLVHGSLQVGRVLLGVPLRSSSRPDPVIVVVLGVLHLGNDAVHVQHIGSVLFLQDLDAALLQEGIEGVYIHAALCRQRLGLLRRQGAFAFSSTVPSKSCPFLLSPSHSGEPPEVTLLIVSPCCLDHKAAVDAEHLSGDVPGILSGRERPEALPLLRRCRKRPTGVSSASAALSSAVNAAIISVSMTPGATQFTVMPLGPSSLASALVRPMRPRFRSGIVYLAAAAGLAPHAAHGQDAARLCGGSSRAVPAGTGGTRRSGSRPASAATRPG